MPSEFERVLNSILELFMEDTRYIFIHTDAYIISQIIYLVGLALTSYLHTNIFPKFAGNPWKSCHSQALYIS